MKHYTAYGLTIKSEFPLPELPTVSDNGGADVVFETDTVKPVTQPDSETETTTDGERIWVESGRRIRATPDRCWLTYESVGTFCVENGQRVRFDPHTPEIAETMKVRRLFENEMCGLLAHQRGCLVLHASAVDVDGTAAIFIGPRRAGKSTTATAFHSAGYDILEDDVVAIRFDEGVPVVLPGVPQLRLRPDVAASLDVEATTRTDDGGSNKYYQEVDDVPDPAPLGGIYRLREGETLTLEQNTGHDQLFELLTQTYARGLLGETETTADHFEQCGAILESVPFQTLSRPLEYEILPSVVELVERALQTHNSTAINK